jgi:hypothetical protein
VNDDIVRTDLTHEVHGSRAILRHELIKVEEITLEAKLPGWLGGSFFKLTARVQQGSAQAAGLATLLLVAACSLLAGISFAIGVPALTAVIIGLCVSVGAYVIIRAIDVISHR